MVGTCKEGRETNYGHSFSVKGSDWLRKTKNKTAEETEESLLNQ